MKMISDFFIAFFKLVVKNNLPALKFFLINSLNPGSYIGDIPEFNFSIFFLSLSTHITVFPKSEKQVPLTRPTYPVPIIHMFI